MLISAFKCPGCGLVLRPANPQPAGRILKCYRCAREFPVPPYELLPEEAAASRVTPRAGTARSDGPNAGASSDFTPSELGIESRQPRRTRRRFRKKATSHTGIIVGVLVGFGTMLLVLLILLLVAYASGWFGHGVQLLPDPRVTPEAYERLDLGMTPAQIEAMLGGGAVVRENSLPDVESSDGSRDLQRRGAELRVREWRRWLGPSASIYVGFSFDGNRNLRATVISCIQQVGNATSADTKSGNDPLHRPPDEPRRPEDEDR
jgi:hypothetical protein